jgi:hypothetical protein
VAITTQYNPNARLNAELLGAGVSRTVYALVTPETEAAKAETFGDEGSETRAEYLAQFREAWTGKQDRRHEEFFDVWHDWAKPVVKLDRGRFPFCYPTAGASEPLRHIIFDFAAKGGRAIHVFRGEYEGYKAMAEASGLEVVEYDREGPLDRIAAELGRDGLFFISQPSAIDGDVWPGFNSLMKAMPEHRVVVDLTYVGAVPPVAERFDMDAPSVRAVVFSLSKPFGAYYDRIGGVFSRTEDPGLFGNKWFKSLTALRLGVILMRRHDVCFMPNRYGDLQREAAAAASRRLGFDFRPSHVFVLATAVSEARTEMADYLRRAGKLRVCLTPGMAAMIDGWKT